jgi:ABC-type branched-subunit amino acid transport system ATPase component
VLLFAAVLVGGATTLLGPAIGIVLLYIIPTAVINIQGYSQFVYGGIILVSVILFPGGVEQAVVDRYKQRRARTRRERLEVELPAMEQPLRSGERRTAVAAANRGDLQISLAHMLRALREDVQPAGEIVVRGAVKRFGGVAALDFEAGDSISVVPGKVHLLLGPNGSGKTTLLNATSGLTRLDSGTVTIGELTVTKHAPARIARMGVSRSFQGPSLPPELTPRELLGASLAHMRNVSYVHWVTSNPIAARVRQAARAQAGEILTAAGLGAAIDEPCSRLTSGQTRTVDVIMALTSRSTLVMLDEPAAGLSEIERRRLAETIRALAESGIGFLVVEHDMELAFGLADHVTVLGQGRIIASGAPDEIKEDQQVREVLIGPTG